MSAVRLKNTGAVALHGMKAYPQEITTPVPLSAIADFGTTPRTTPGATFGNCRFWDHPSYQLNSLIFVNDSIQPLPQRLTLRLVSVLQ